MPNFQNQFSQSAARAVRPEQTLPEDVPQTADAQALPPFDVMLSWLSYYHEQTGEWCTPPTTQNGMSVATPEAIGLIPFPARATKQVATISPKSREMLNSATSKSEQTATGYNYVNSIYFECAGRLIERFAKHRLDELAAFDCQRALSLILAWCNFPLFRNVSGRSGQWMTLATATAARELNMRVATFTHCIAELERAGLLIAQSAGSGIISRTELEQLKYDCGRLAETTESTENIPAFWSVRSVQSKSTIYRLDERLLQELALPEFQPMSEIPAGNTLQQDAEIPGTEKPDNIRPFPVYMNHESLKHDDESLLRNGINGRENPNTVADSLNEEERQKYEFLITRATFAGFETQGRNSLDTAEALKFACTLPLTFGVIQERYNQVAELWQKGKCRNPLGMLHWSLSNNRDPRGFESPVRSVQPPNINRYHRRDDKQKPARSKPDRFAKLAQTLAKSATSEHYGETENAAEVSVPQLDIAQIWREVRHYDLPGRFHVTDDNLRLLNDSILEYTTIVADNSSVKNLHSLRLVLRSALEERLLDAATRNVIRIALRQRLGLDFQLSFGICEKAGE